MGRVLTYLLPGEPSKAFMGIRMRGIDNHTTFVGNEREGEFCRQFPETSMELRGLYTIDDGMLSVILTDVPEECPHETIESLFDELVNGPLVPR